MFTFKRNPIFWGFSVLYLLVASAAFIPSEDKAVESEIITMEINAEDFGPPCRCEYLVSGASGLNSFVVTQSGNPIFDASALGNHSGSFTVSAPYTYTVSWESFNGGTASVGMECCNLNCQITSVTIPSGSGSATAFNYSTSGCSSSGSCGPVCW